jgi:uncharacterized protein (TIGR03000 family)
MFKHGSSGGSNGSSGGSYGSNGSSGGYYVATTGGAPAVASNTAYLTVNVPDDAKVYLQDQLMTLGGTQRRFVTPQLPAGSDHVYTLRVEVVRDGQTITKTTQAPVAVGQEVEVTVTLDQQNPKELVTSIAQVASR